MHDQQYKGGLKQVRSALLFLSVVFVSSASYGVEKPVLNDWFALGSGCKAKHDLAGSVRMERLPVDPRAPDKVQVRFFVQDFSLNEQMVRVGRAQFARECSIRLSVNPPSGKRLREVSAGTSLRFEKSAGVGLDLLAQLKLGASELGQSLRKFPAERVVGRQEETVNLIATSASKDFPELGCGEPKIIGFDYSWIAEQEKNKKTSLQVELGSERLLTITVGLEDCHA